MECEQRNIQGTHYIIITITSSTPNTIRHPRAKIEHTIPSTNLKRKFNKNHTKDVTSGIRVSSLGPQSNSIYHYKIRQASRTSGEQGNTATCSKTGDLTPAPSPSHGSTARSSPSSTRCPACQAPPFHGSTARSSPSSPRCPP